ncbi:MAG: hypothetical protein V3U39_11305, partial [Acidimicrobiia bacterium]
MTMIENATLSSLKSCQPDLAASDRLVEVAQYINRDPGVMSRGLRKLEVRLEEDRKLQTRIGKLQLGIRKDRKVKIATRQG